MISLVVDASIAAKWVVEEEGSAEAIELRTRARLIAPELLVSEFANILWKKVRKNELSSGEALFAVRLIQVAEIELVPTARVVEAAMRIAITLDHAVYDCVYLATALDRKCQFVTADKTFVRKLETSAEGQIRDVAVLLREAV